MLCTDCAGRLCCRDRCRLALDSCRLCMLKPFTALSSHREEAALAGDNDAACCAVAPGDSGDQSRNRVRDVVVRDGGRDTDTRTLPAASLVMVEVAVYSVDGERARLDPSFAGSFLPEPAPSPKSVLQLDEGQFCTVCDCRGPRGWRSAEEPPAPVVTPSDLSDPTNNALRHCLKVNSPTATTLRPLLSRASSRPC